MPRITGMLMADSKCCRGVFKKPEENPRVVEAFVVTIINPGPTTGGQECPVLKRARYCRIDMIEVQEKGGTRNTCPYRYTGTVEARMIENGAMTSRISRLLIKGGKRGEKVLFQPMVETNKKKEESNWSGKERQLPTSWVILGSYGRSWLGFYYYPIILYSKLL